MELLGAIVSDYKSVRMCEVPLAGLTVLFGPNGVGKTNLLEAIASYDPASRAVLDRGAPAQRRRSRPRVGLVTRLDITGGTDRQALSSMLLWPWLNGFTSDDISQGIGAFCGSTWWFDGGTLAHLPQDADLRECLAQVRASLLRPVPVSSRATADELLNVLLTDPVLIVQEDFAVELSVDRSTAAGRRAQDLAAALQPQLPNCGLAHLIGVLRGWTGRWPPLTLLTRGPADPAAPMSSGFSWVARRLGGVEVVSGDVRTLEAHLDRTLPAVHDRQMHNNAAGSAEDPEDDILCDTCLEPDHAGRVDPTMYADPDMPGDETPIDYPRRGSWLDTDDDWVRVRTSLRVALSLVENSANRRLVGFVARTGRVVLSVRSPAEWDGEAARCAVAFEFSQPDSDELVAAPGGPVGVAGWPVGPRQPDTLTVPLAALGAGMRRWVAAAVRLAVSDLSRRETDGGGHDSAPPQIVLIDEPEQHLHPQAQADVARWCLEEGRGHHTLLVATHSAAFLSLPPEAVTVCQVTRVGFETLVRPLPPVHGPAAVHRARQLGFELGLGRDALAQLTRAVLVVEGEWDREVLLAFFGRELAEQRVLVVPLQGSEELGGMADAAVLPALGVPVVALLDDVRAATPADFARLPGPLTKAERALRDLTDDLDGAVGFVRYEEPDVICALPEDAVRRAFPDAAFPGWDALLTRWRGSDAADKPFKRFAVGQFGLPKPQRTPAAFFRAVLAAAEPSDRPTRPFAAAVKQALGMVTEPESRP